MDKFRDITGVNNQMGFQTNKFDVDNLNQRYNDLINRFQQQMFVTKETRNIGDELVNNIQIHLLQNFLLWKQEYFQFAYKKMMHLY